MVTQIININSKHSEPISKAIKLLNLSQTDFHFDVCQFKDEVQLLQNDYSTYCKLTNGNIDSIVLKQIVQKYFRKDNILFVSIISELLMGETYINLFSEIITEEGTPINYSIITDFDVKPLLKGIPFEIYFIYNFLIFSIFFASKQYIAHTETEINYCIFDYLVNKSHITNILKTGNMCLDCQIILDNSLNLSQILSINSILRIIGRIARSQEPKKLFEDYLFLSESLKNEKEKNNTFSQYREIIEATIAKISKTVVEEKLDSNLSLQRHKFKSQIVKGNFDKVFYSLISDKKIREDKVIYNEIIILQSRQYRLESDLKNGIINIENRELRQNQISKSLIEIIDKI